ncbi:MAG: malto-oligosyltrehalose synthase [Pseudomonadota bacterium]
MSIPLATARLQLHADFGFDAAAATVDYFAKLGISHLYASPIFTAQPGSTHGYDGVDVECVSPALGGEAGLRRLVDRLHQAGMGLIIDIVPNHMGIASANNPWWQHVLEWGQASRFATWFDIDWQRSDDAIRGKVLLPFLGQQYGKVLAAGELKLQFDHSDGRIFVGYHSNRFPITPGCYPQILSHADSAMLKPILAECENIGNTAAGSEPASVCNRLKDTATGPAGIAAIMSALAFFDASTPAGAAKLHALLEAQHYRLAWWRYGADGLNWRRFFEVTDLAGVRVENEEVFETTHALVFRLYEEGLIDGVRIDHVDGLADPTGYCKKLRQSLSERAPRRPQGDDGPAYIVVEKILAADEMLRSDWQVDGTTGYDFMDQVGALLHAADGVAELDLAWAEISPGAASFDEEVRVARRQLLISNLAAEFDAACQALVDLARTSLVTRDYSFNAIRRVFTELLVQFPVYRTYVQNGMRESSDQKVFTQAVADARPHINRADLDLLTQLDIWLGGEIMCDQQASAMQARAIRRFQQLTPPLVAKSVEDTAFYRYGRLLSRNQVGSDPGQFALSPARFDAACKARATNSPHAMLATATHDHKRGEDVTARLAVLSEIPQHWREYLKRWRMMNARHRAPQATQSQAPSAADEAMLYQILVGAWPIGLAADDAVGIAELKQRVSQWQQKALREAKTSTDWVEPNVAYEQACDDFLEAILSNLHGNVFVAELAAWVHEIIPAGIVNSLTQMVLRLTLPGMPDLYQGTDLWDFSLVDPDNRQPVDYQARAEILDANADRRLGEISWQTGALKQRILHSILTCRRQYAEVFATGLYEPLAILGPLAGHLFAFRRYRNGIDVVVIVTRLAADLTIGTGMPFIPATRWDDTVVALPAGAATTWTNVLTNTSQQSEDGGLAVAVALAEATVAVLVSAPAA